MEREDEEAGGAMGMWKKRRRHLGCSSDDNSNGALSADADRADFLARLLVPLALPSSYNFIPDYV